jgi:hypothetical protein
MSCAARLQSAQPLLGERLRRTAIRGLAAARRSQVEDFFRRLPGFLRHSERPVEDFFHERPPDGRMGNPERVCYRAIGDIGLKFPD